MRVMALLKSSPSDEGRMPTTEELEAMGKFNAELVEAGVMLTGEGLHESAKGVKVKFSGGGATVTDGPFTEAKELIAGFWILKVKSMQEAADWIKRTPMGGEDAEIELRQVFEEEDFGEAFTPELKEAEQKTRAKAEQNAGA